VEASYELFDHTADMGIRVRAATLDGLVSPAVEGFYSAIGELAAGDDVAPFALSLNGDDAATLLRDFLTELLILFEREKRMVKTIDQASLSDRRLSVRGTTARVDPDRSVFCREVKAVTYHALKIVNVPGGFEATFIVDI